MRSIRDNFLSAFAAGVDLLSEPPVPLPSLGLNAEVANGGMVGRAVIPPLKKFAAWLRKKQNRKRALLVVWVMSVFILFALSAAALFGSHYLRSTYKPGVVITTVLWGFFLGIWILFAFPPKLITTLFGGVAGISLAEIGSNSGLLAKLNTFVAEVTTQIGVIAGNPDGQTRTFIVRMVWLFIAVFLIICLPAFVRDD